MKVPKTQSAKAYSYSYSSTNQLLQVQIFSDPLGPVEKRISYRYDVLGRRISKLVEDLTVSAPVLKSYQRQYQYDGDNIMAELDGEGQLLAKYTHSPLQPDDILSAEFTSTAVTAGLSQSTGKVYYLKDHLGSVNTITNAVGSVIQKYEYSSFGKLLSLKNASGVEVAWDQAPVRTQFTYTSREWEPETGLCYYRARYYDASTGRFLQVDPDPGSVSNPITVINKYIYVGNSPILRTDPSGKFWWFVLSAAVSFAINYTTAVNSGASVGQALISGLIGAASGLIAPGLGAYLVERGVNSVSALVIGNILAGAFNGAAHASVFGGSTGQSALLGGAAGLIAGTLQIGTASLIYDIGFNRAASRFLSEPFGYFGGLTINSGQEFPNENEHGGTIRQVVPVR